MSFTQFLFLGQGGTGGVGLGSPELIIGLFLAAALICGVGLGLGAITAWRIVARTGFKPFWLLFFCCTMGWGLILFLVFWIVAIEWQPWDHW
jgi:hypothetical protein